MLSKIKETILLSSASAKDKEFVFSIWKENPAILADSIQFAIEEEKQGKFRAIWFLDNFFVKEKELFKNWQSVWIAGLKKAKTSSGKRLYLRVFVHNKIDYKEDEGFILNFVIEHFKNPFEEIAVRASSMKILEKMLPKYPELCNEITLIIEDYPEQQKAAMQIRIREMKKLLKKLNNNKYQK